MLLFIPSYTKCTHYEAYVSGYVLEGFPTLSEGYLSTTEQLELVKNWKLKPDFIVNVKVSEMMLCGHCSSR